MSVEQMSEHDVELVDQFMRDYTPYATGSGRAIRQALLRMIVEARSENSQRLLSLARSEDAMHEWSTWAINVLGQIKALSYAVTPHLAKEIDALLQRQPSL